MLPHGAGERLSLAPFAHKWQWQLPSLFHQTRMLPAGKRSLWCCYPALILCQALLQGAASQGKHTAGKVLLTGHFWVFLTKQPELCLALPGQRGVTVPSSLCSPPMERGSLSDSNLGLPWTSLTGSQIDFCEEEFPVSSCLFNTTLCAEVFSEKGFAIHCFHSAPFLGPQGFCSPPWAEAHFRLVWYRADKHPSKCHHPHPICARGELEVLLRHKAIYPQLLSNDTPRAWEVPFLPSPWELALQN